MAAVKRSRTTPVKRRMHPIGVITTILQALRQFLFLFVAAFVSGDSVGSGAWIQVGLLAMAVLYGVGRWWRLRYWFEGGAMRVSDGFLFHREVFLDSDKVQAVDIRAGIVQRLFDVVRVQVKSGATGTQVDLTALSRTEAERIQRLLDPEGWAADPVQTGKARAVAVPHLDTVVEGDTPPVAASPIAPPEPASPGWRMSSRELVALGATSGQLGVIGSAIAYFFSQAQERFTNWLEANLETLVGNADGVSSVLGPTVIVVLILGLLALTWALSIIGTAISWGDFSVKRRRDRVLVARGLLERREISVQGDRIQAITVVEPLLHQPLGRCEVYVESIGHAEEKGASTCLHPFLKIAELPAFLEEIAPGFYGAPALHRPPPRALPRFLVRPSLTVFAAATVAFFVWDAIGLLVLLALLWVCTIGWLSWRDTGAGVVGNTVVVRSRRASRRTAYLPRNRIQTVSANANLFQRRRSVASFSVVAASGASGRVYVARDLDDLVPMNLLEWAGRLGPAPTPPAEHAA